MNSINKASYRSLTKKKVVLGFSYPSRWFQAKWVKKSYIQKLRIWFNGLFDFGCSPCLSSSKNEQEMSHWILKIC